MTFQARYLPLDDLKSTTRDWRSAPDANAILLKIAKLRNQLADLERVAKLLQTELKPDQPPSVQIQRDGITLFHDNQLDILKQGAPIELGNGVHEFVEVPTDLDAKWYNRRGGYQGITRFRVDQTQRVVIALYGQDWGSGGNSSGGWQSELTSKQELIDQGWEPIGQLPVKHSNPQYADEPPWILFARNCEPNETFAIRNHKYQAPAVIWGNSVE